MTRGNKKTGLNGVAQFAALVNAYESVIKIIVELKRNVTFIMTRTVCTQFALTIEPTIETEQ